MTTSALRPPVTVVPRRGELASFFALAFGLTWGIALALLLARPVVEAVTGPFDTAGPLYFLAVYAPSLAAVALTGARRGRAGLRELARRLDPRRVRLRDALLVLVGWTIMDFVARLLQSIVVGVPLDAAGGDVTVWDTMPPTTLSTLWAAPALLLVTLLLDAGPLGEELGWRGYALPRLLAPRPVTLVGLSADPGVRPARRRKALVPALIRHGAAAPRPRGVDASRRIGHSLGPSDNAAGGRLGRREPGEKSLDRAPSTGRHPLAVAVGLGLVWGVWHLPAFFVAGTHQHDDGMAIAALIIGTTLSSVLMTWLFLRTRGNVLVSGILAHLMTNVTVADLWATVAVFALPAAAAAVSLVRGARTPVAAGTASRDAGGWTS